MPFHSKSTDNHKIYAYTCANQATMEAVTTFTSDDVGKLVKLTDSGSYWEITVGGEIPTFAPVVLKGGGSKSAIGGGQDNQASGGYAWVGGGYANQATASTASVGAGASNVASAVGASVLGGRLNEARAIDASIGGGNSNTSDGQVTAIAGGRYNAIAADADYSAVGGGEENEVTANGSYAVVGGGYQNVADATRAVIPGGSGAKASNVGQFAFASGIIAAPGDSQMSIYSLRAATAGNETATMTLGDEGGASLIEVPDGALWAWKLWYAARSADASAMVAGWVEGYVIHDGATFNVSINAENTMVHASINRPIVQAGTGTLDLVVTGLADTPVNWSAYLQVCEVMA